jgi:phosphopantothenoylcysteine decarboxylase/phosphopantothenate--cysteine ligase
MNRLMWANAATQDNLARLKARGVTVLGPGSGAQACGETGDGRMLEPAALFAAVANTSTTARVLQGLHAVVTAGPTREPIDPVRFITNRSSGKQGYAVAAALVERGARVTLISGPTDLPTPAGATRIDVESAEQMLGLSLAAAAEAQIFVGAAAVADYRAEAVAPEKIKKSGDSMTLTLTKNPDILATVRAAHPELFMVGFAAETERLAEHAKAKLQNKKLDLIAANWVGDGKAFDRDDNALSLFRADGNAEIAHGLKGEVARALVDHLVTLYQKRP